MNSRAFKLNAEIQALIKRQQQNPFLYGMQ